MIVDRRRFQAPHPPWVLEVADQLFLFGVHADDGQSTLLETLFLPGDAMKLLVALLVRNRHRFAIGMQSIAELIEQSPHGVGTDSNV